MDILFKRIKIVIIGFVIILNLGSTNVFALDTSGISGDVNWKLENNVLTISGTGAMADYTGAEDHAPWLEINTCEAIKTIVIGEGVTHIGNRAFSGCSNVTSVTIASSVKTIGEAAFNFCTSLNLVNIPNCVEIIGKDAFVNCTSLSSVNIPSTLKEIGEEAFFRTKLTNVRVPAECILLGGNTGVFDSTTVITYYGTCGTNISWELNEGTGVLSLNGTGPMTEFESSQDGVITPWKEYSSKIRSLVIGDEITTISMGAFYSCSNLSSVTFGSGLKTIEDMAFTNTGLTSVNIPGNVTSIGQYSFYECKSLSTITLSEGLEIIGSAAFAGCNSESVVLPASVTSVGGSAFNGIVYKTIYNLSEMVLEDAMYRPEYANVYSPLSLGIGVTANCEETKNYNGKILYKAGSLITLTPENNKEISNVTVNNQPITEQDGIYSFSMPAGATSVAFTIKDSASTVTVSLGAVSEDNINVQLNGSGEYTSGSSVTVEAPIFTGYNFVGWYQAFAEAPGYTGNILCKNRVYTFKVTENTNLVAVYKPLAMANVTIDGGSSYTINGSEYTSQNRSSYSLGSTVTVKVNNTVDFAYWTNEHGMILSRNASYTFTVTGSMTLTAVFNTKAENKSTVIFESYYGQVLKRTQLGSGDTFTLPDGPTRYGYTFTGWSMTEQKIKDEISAGTAVIKVIPVYELINQSYSINVVGGTGSGSYNQNDVVTATANAPEEGKKFSHWTDADDNILSYSTTYKLYATKNVEITANYVVETTVVEAKGTAQIIDIKKDTANSKISFVSMLTVPEGCTIQMAGIIATNAQEVGTSGDGFNKDTAAYVRGNAWSGNAYRYTWTKKVTATETWYVRAYLVYKDTNGNLVTVYGDIVSAKLSD